ncbi:tRNA pseudouridine38-40 synthase [Epsilonproteobacteria bacterium SCGC AD-308-O04]|nr:tRNA pseudouridine38-40 synthase [Epsilonproteobacteria bacterium SCGC AD-308-O04]
MRCALTIAYNGTNFFGSQIQKETSNTILGNLEHVLKQLGINVKVIASGRTDKGVHATGQVCHVDLPEFWDDLEKLKKVLNQMLPSSIHVKNIKAVSDDFHARYGAKKRVYRYIIKQENSNPFFNDFVTFLEHVEFEKLQKNIRFFIGEHDFKNFMKTGSDVNSTTRVVYRAFAYKHKGFIVLNFEANGFLRSQIRLMVGALLKLTKEEIQEQLECKKTHKIKPAPANGLYLAKIKYS